MDPVKIARVCDWPTLWNCIGIQAFLRFTNFYYKFIHSFLDIACSFFNVTSNNTAWTWRLEWEHAFTALKITITTTLVLALLNTSALFRVKVVSLDFTTATVLFQNSRKDNKWHLVTFFSKFLSIVEYNYEIHNKKMLAVIWALEEWRYFLEDVETPVEIWTDYKNLGYFMIAKKLNYRQA